MYLIPRPVPHRLVRRVTLPAEVVRTHQGAVLLVAGDAVLADAAGRFVACPAADLFARYVALPDDQVAALEATVDALAAAPASRYGFVVLPVGRHRVPPPPAAAEPVPEADALAPCARTDCRRRGAVCRHTHDGRMYCVPCARRINDANRGHGPTPLVEIPVTTTTEPAAADERPMWFPGRAPSARPAPTPPLTSVHRASGDPFETALTDVELRALSAEHDGLMWRTRGDLDAAAGEPATAADLGLEPLEPDAVFEPDPSDTDVLDGSADTRSLRIDFTTSQLPDAERGGRRAA